MLATVLARHWGVALAAALALFGGMQTWRIDRLHQDIVARDGALRASEAKRAAAEEALKARDVALAEKVDADRRNAGELAVAMTENCKAAFDAGYASRRCDTADVGGGRDLRQLWRSGAFPGSQTRSGKTSD